MSLLSQVVLLYMLIGLGVAGAIWLRTPAGPGWFQIAAALPFWPIYLTILLSRPDLSEGMASTASHPISDGMAAAIEQVDAELERALGSLDGWAEGVLARERHRIRELRHAWTGQAERIREIDCLLELPDYSLVSINGQSEEAKEMDSPELFERLEASCRARQSNIERLRQIRSKARAELMGTLAWVRELVSMIHLAKFTGAPASRAEELVAQIAAAVEGLSEVTWQDERHVAGST
jgi:hypothetical protein